MKFDERAHTRENERTTLRATRIEARRCGAYRRILDAICARNRLAHKTSKACVHEKRTFQFTLFLLIRFLLKCLSMSSCVEATDRAQQSCCRFQKAVEQVEQSTCFRWCCSPCGLKWVLHPANERRRTFLSSLFAVQSPRELDSVYVAAQCCFLHFWMGG